MNARVPNLSRRQFIVGTTAVSTGLSLGLTFPFAIGSAHAALSTPEIGAWVVIKPDDSVVIRVVRSEMGQGTITGLAQMVAEELECDWNKVSVEYPTPGESLKRKRVWGDFSTGGSRGIRTSEEYVRKGGAAARMMLVDAAAAQPARRLAECRAHIKAALNGRGVAAEQAAAERRECDGGTTCVCGDFHRLLLLNAPGPSCCRARRRRAAARAAWPPRP